MSKSQKIFIFVLFVFVSQTFLASKTSAQIGGPRSGTSIVNITPAKISINGVVPETKIESIPPTVYGTTIVETGTTNQTSGTIPWVYTGQTVTGASVGTSGTFTQGSPFYTTNNNILGSIQPGNNNALIVSGQLNSSGIAGPSIVGGSTYLESITQVCTNGGIITAMSEDPAVVVGGQVITNMIWATDSVCSVTYNYATVGSPPSGYNPPELNGENFFLQLIPSEASVYRSGSTSFEVVVQKNPSSTEPLPMRVNLSSLCYQSGITCTLDQNYVDITDASEAEIAVLTVSVSSDKSYGDYDVGVKGIYNGSDYEEREDYSTLKVVPDLQVKCDNTWQTIPSQTSPSQGTKFNIPFANNTVADFSSYGSGIPYISRAMYGTPFCSSPSAYVFDVTSSIVMPNIGSGTWLNYWNFNNTCGSPGLPNAVSNDGGLFAKALGPWTTYGEPVCSTVVDPETGEESEYCYAPETTITTDLTYSFPGGSLLGPTSSFPKNWGQRTTGTDYLNRTWQVRTNPSTYVSEYMCSPISSPDPDLKITVWADWETSCDPSGRCSSWNYLNSDGPAQVYEEAPYKLSWGDISNASNCTLDGVSLLSTSASSIDTYVAPATGSVTHTLSCIGPGGASSDSIDIDVIPFPTCSSVEPEDIITTLISGTLDFYAYNVQNASAVKFWTWSEINGQDDIVAYDGVNQGEGTWKGSVDLAHHRTENPDYGNFLVHVWMTGLTENKFCDGVNFTRSNQAVADIKANRPGDPPSNGPITIPYNSSINVSWSYSNASSCVLTPPLGPITSYPNGNGNYNVSGITSGRNYSITCNPGSFSDSVQVNVNAPSTNNLNLTKTRQGAVTSSPSGINCGVSCLNQSAPFEENSVVILTASPQSPRIIFVGWAGDCSGRSSTCSLTMNNAKNVTAIFAIDPNFKEF